MLSLILYIYLVVLFMGGVVYSITEGKEDTYHEHIEEYCRIYAVVGRIVLFPFLFGVLFISYIKIIIYNEGE